MAQTALARLPLALRGGLFHLLVVDPGQVQTRVDDELHRVGVRQMWQVGRRPGGRDAARSRACSSRYWSYPVRWSGRSPAPPACQRSPERFRRAASNRCWSVSIGTSLSGVGSIR